MAKITRIAVVVAVAVMATGCAGFEKTMKYNFAPSIEVAKEECSNIGFRAGTSQYQNCVLQQTQNIRNARAQAAAQASANSASMMRSMKTVHCTNDGYNIRCQEF